MHEERIKRKPGGFDLLVPERVHLLQGISFTRPKAVT
jgi:hypothetical protein